MTLFLVITKFHIDKCACYTICWTCGLKKILDLPTMTNEEKQQLRDLIPERIERIKVDIAELVELTKPIEPDCAIGRVSRMDAINNKSINDASLVKKKIQLEGLQAALDNLDSVDFGKCLICGNEMQMGRILIMPESRKCMACASRN